MRDATHLFAAASRRTVDTDRTAQRFPAMPVTGIPVQPMMPAPASASLPAKFSHSAFGMSEPGSDPSSAVPPARSARTEPLAMARRRRAPRFAIVDDSAAIVMTSIDAEDPDWPVVAFPAEVIVELVAEVEAGETADAFALTGPTTVVRATRLTGGTGRYYALFIEYVESRDLLANASEQFGLSMRELDVLRLILLGMDSAAIAHRLCIAKGTVHAHVKNIGRKTQSTKRTEILAKLLGIR